MFKKTVLMEIGPMLDGLVPTYEVDKGLRLGWVHNFYFVKSLEKLLNDLDAKDSFSCPGWGKK